VINLQESFLTKMLYFSMYFM